MAVPGDEGVIGAVEKVLGLEAAAAFPAVALVGIGEMKLTNAHKEKIEQAVKEAEEKTSGEIVPIILKKSDSYPASHFRLAILVGLSVSMILYFLPIHLGDPAWLLWVQIPGLLLGYLLAFLPKFKRFFSTRAEIREEVHQRAVELFFHYGLHTTKERAGILIFVSMLEHRVEILADAGINEKVEEGTWDNVLARLLKSLSEENPVDGICQAVSECGKVLKVHFPISEEDKNDDELENAPITDEDVGRE